MTNTSECSIDVQTIEKLGLTQTEIPINAQIAPNARIFTYPYLDNVFIMESDLYGNAMPKESCFLAFNGKHGLIGKHLSIETLINSSLSDIEAIVHSHNES